MKQEYWNKTSLAIRLNVLTLKVRIDKLRFSDNALTVQRTDYKPLKLTHGSGRIYATVFHFVFFTAKMRRIVMNFVRDPKVPRLKHLYGILRLAKSRKYS
jgi:hypothetical protein